MEEELISKKDLLALTGISYGALYRWKRKKLIPEEWFIKKSTFTGPETFFPKDRVLERIEKIIKMKEQLSLDDMAQTFSDKPIDITLTAQELVEREVLSPAIYGLKMCNKDEQLDFYGTFYLHVCDKLMNDGSLSISEADSALSLMLSNYKKFDRPPVLGVYRKMGVTFCALYTEGCELDFDASVFSAALVKCNEQWEGLKARLGGGKNE